jgi:D-xylose 1-dehydrogenase (NADP+, D-xylono-1,5-lactone-forming)
MQRKLRWGVLGTANIGRAAVNPAIQTSRNGTLVAVASRDRERAETFAAKWNIPTAHGSYEALLDDPGIDAVYIPLPNRLHFTWTVRAAERGKHVLCEKPLAMTADECLEMKRACDAHGVQLMEAFMYRLHPRTRDVVRRVAIGELGEVGIVRSAFTFRVTRPENIRLSAELGGGALMDVGCYCVNVSRTLLGQEPAEVQAFATWTSSGVDGTMAGSLRFGSGAVALFDCALTLERREFYEVGGTLGSFAAEAAFLPGTADVTLLQRHPGGKETRHKTPGVDQYRLMVEHFADAVLEGTPLLHSAEEAARNMAVIEALYRSARREGAPEPVPAAARDAAR